MKPYRRSYLRLRPAPAAPPPVARPRTAEDGPLPDLNLLAQHVPATTTRPTRPVRRRSSERCHAVGLVRGDCEQHRAPGSVYCYYHDKVQAGTLEPSAPGVYPILPLPVGGYVMTANPGRLTLAELDGELVAG